jgi:hypothetical protein
MTYRRPFKTTPEELEKMTDERLSHLYAHTFWIWSGMDRTRTLAVLKRHIDRIMDTVEESMYQKTA